MDFNEDSPEYCLQFLGGIVSEDICAIFDVDKSLLTKSVGLYADPNSRYYDCTMNHTEYCCETYSNKCFKLVKYSNNVDFCTGIKW